MISFTEAYDMMIGSAPVLGSETVPLADAANRILAQDVTADVNMPPFDKAAMDGYACRRTDLGNLLTVIETIPAGRMPSLTVGPGQCSRIMTGAPVPAGADCVIMQEHTESPGPETVRFTGRSTDTNICRMGEDIAQGDTVLRRGDRIGPAQIAVLASVGVAWPTVASRPRVSVLATGSELVPPDRQPPGGMIRDSNSFQLCAQVRNAGAIADHVGIVPDTREALCAAIRHATEDHDLVLLSGGVSTGSFDFVPATLRENGFELLFESVAMQPGRPMVYGRSPGGVFCCGLPGNPVSTYVVFELLVKPFLLKMMGHAQKPIVAAAVMGEPFSRRRTERQTAMPVRFSGPGTVMPVPYHGSAHIHAMCVADAILVIPAGVAAIAKGEVVNVRLL
jgi:molybdopterin molybdotransferase